jgi:hypothetical protein
MVNKGYIIKEGNKKLRIVECAGVAAERAMGC